MTAANMPVYYAGLACIISHAQMRLEELPAGSSAASMV